MKIQTKTVKKAISKAYDKQSIKRADIELLKVGLQKLYHRFNELEFEEHLKNIISDFLKETWYSSRFEINTKERIDLAIYNGKTSKDTVGVIIEVKKPQSPERMTEGNINCKALHELILYYFEEREEKKNIEIKHLITTNINEWFIFDENEFDKLFYRNTKLQKLYKSKIEQSKDNPFFYSEAQKIIADLEDEIVCAHFNLIDFEKIASNIDNNDDKKLIELYKILSPEHLLKLPFLNDSNSLNKEFYNELLHIIGLEETKEGSKKLINRKKPESRNEGSLLENTINCLRMEGCLDNVTNAEQYGTTEEDRLFSVGLELCINWLNRILFLKLLEGQLISYHRQNKDFSFLNATIIQNFDELNELFFEVLAVTTNERSNSVNEKFGSIPYLNSSLFERSELENHTIRINSLKDRLELPVYKSTVIKDGGGSRIKGMKTTLHYLFGFLDAYDFASEGTGKIQEQNKNMINASVLGLIFEKINGYKDGSFFTPGFITMYMCRETLRRAIVQKFNEHHNWNIIEFNDLKDKIDCTDKTVRQQANNIINSLKVCDPAVGSGHFLVSALNEIIAIKSELGVLQYRDGSRIRGNKLTIENDELIIIDEETDQIFEYRLNQNSKPLTDLQSLQETIFHEKQTIIENCLFGVDINPKSVMICRLRLWVELLKNAYYTKESTYTELETLPNIDINIKCGNSLISRFALDCDLKQALKKSKWNIDTYRIAVQTYRNASSKAEKREMEKLIDSIKNDFESEIARNDKRFLRLVKLKGDLTSYTTQTTLFEKTKKEKEDWTKQVNALTNDIQKFETELEEIKNNAIYRSAFEWRFEFPEVLNNEGEYVGFDVVIGNPPYGIKEKGKNYLDMVEKFYPIARKTPDSYFLFMIQAIQIAKQFAFINCIVPNTFCDIEQGDKFRDWILNYTDVYKLWDTSWAFDSAIVDTVVYFQRKVMPASKNIELINSKQEIVFLPYSEIKLNQGFKIDFRTDYKNKGLLNRIISLGKPLINYCSVKAGVKLYEKGKGSPPQDEQIMKTKPYSLIGKQLLGWRPLIRGEKIDRYLIKTTNEFVNYGAWLAAPRDENSFTGERIVIRRTDDIIRAAFTNDDSICVNSCHILKVSDNLSIYYLLGILNSKLIQWIFSQQNPQMIGKVFAEIKVIYIENLPVIIPKEQTIKSIATKVQSILAVKQSNPQTDTNELENLIDQLVYELYGLTEDEIKIVDGDQN